MSNNLSIIQSQVEEDASHDFSIVIPSKNQKKSDSKKKQDPPL
jgi:hypothetical protein